jgi:hypothetical protein
MHVKLIPHKQQEIELVIKNYLICSFDHNTQQTFHLKLVP